MKRKLRTLLLASAVITIMCAVPAMAQELTPVDPKPTEQEFIAFTTKHNTDVANQLNSFVKTQVNPVACQAHVDTVVTQLKNFNRGAADNYILYRQRRVAGFKETERIKLEVVNNYKWLSQYNPYFASLIPAAEADYNKAVAIRVNEEAAVNQITADFNVLYPR